MRVVEIAKNHGLAVTAGLDTGGLQADADALGAEIALFHDARVLLGKSLLRFLTYSSGLRQLKLRLPYGQAAMQNRQPMQR